MAVVSNLPDTWDAVNALPIQQLVAQILELADPETRIQGTAGLQVNAFLSFSAVKLAKSYQKSQEMAEKLGQFIIDIEGPLKVGDTVTILPKKAENILNGRTGIVTELDSKVNEGKPIGVSLNQDTPTIYFFAEKELRKHLIVSRGRSFSEIDQDTNVVRELRAHTGMDGSRIVIDTDSLHPPTFTVTAYTPKNDIHWSKPFETLAAANKEFERFL